MKSSSGARLRLPLAALSACALFSFASAAAAQTWTAPVGIPAPPFGIVEEAGAFTHYVDNTHPSATDSSNPNGTPARPRLTVPTSLAAGSVVEVRGGPYNATATWTLSGTQAAPVFVKGVGAPRFAGSPPISSSDELKLQGAHFIVEGIKLDGAHVRMIGATRGVFRRNEVTNYSPTSNSSCVQPGGTETVVYANHIHHNGDPLSTAEIDIHGVAPKEGTSRVWIVDNHIHDNGGDAIQVGSSTAGEPWARYVFIGRNELHDDRENAVDVKQSRDVVVSQNRIYGYVPPPDGSDDGTAIVVHDNPDRVWILANQVSDSTNGIRCSGAQDGYYVIGNVVWNIRHLPGDDYDPDSTGGVQAIRAYNTPSFFALNNTVFGSDAGISYPSGSQGEIVNNVVAGLVQPSHHVAVGSSAAGNILKNNVFDATARIRFGSGTVRNCAQTQAAFPSQVQGCINADPRLVDPAGQDFHLDDGSPAIDTGAPHPAYARFQTLYGVAIARDADGNPRPQGAAWDIGAYEKGGAAQAPELSIGDVAVNEGGSGVANAVFTVALTPVSAQAVTVRFATADATANAGTDYNAAAGTLTFPAGTATRTVAVGVRGDTTVEPDETFWVDLSNATGATIDDGQGRGTIRNDDAAVPALSVGDVSVSEGNSGWKAAVFTVALSAPSAQAVSVSFATAGVSAKQRSDYLGASGTLVFPAGTTSRTVTVQVRGDTNVENDETFLLQLTQPTGATIADAQGVGTIVNDDAGLAPGPTVR
jgi:hypothetical protein